MKTLLAAAALAVANTQGASAPALPDADPAIWVVKDPDTTIYLFGTFHAMNGKSDWFNEEVKAAFDQSSEVVLEIPPVEDPASVQPLLAKYAMDPSGKPLTEKLSTATREKYAKALADLGAPVTAFDKFKPFFAALTIVMAGAQKLGLSPANGAEAVLTKAAKASNKPIGALETMEYQLGLFAKMTEAQQIEMLEQTLDQLNKLEPMFAEMDRHWTRGDAEGFAKLMREMDAQSPDAYKALLVDRNAVWAEWVDDRLDKPGTVFVAVGTGHLAGKDSVQNFLARKGIKSDRIAAR